MEFKEIEISRVPGPPFDTTMTRRPKTLKSLSPAAFKYAYRPADAELVRSVLEITGQKITLYPSVPLWLMSPGLRVYRKRDVKEFHGHLHSVEFMDCKPGEVPVVGITISIVPEE